MYIIYHKIPENNLDLLLFSLQEEIGLMIWNRAHAELSYLQEMESWKDKVASAGTGTIYMFGTVYIDCVKYHILDYLK